MAYKFYVLIIHHKQGFQTCMYVCMYMHISIHQADLAPLSAQCEPQYSPLLSGKGRTEENKGDQHLSCHLAATCLH